jgi:HAD superfamily hydrolase (TIGR01509 family)
VLDPQIKGVIFDVDGTLVDSNDAHAHAWVEALAEKSYQVSFEEIRERIGKGGDKLLPEVAGVQKDSPEGKALGERRGEIFKTKYLPHLKPFPGTRDLLQYLHEQGLKLGVATSAEKDELQSLLRVAQVEEFMDKEASSKDAPKSKPDPDVVEAALDKLNLKPEEALMVGDTPYDVEGGNKAGVKVVALRCGGWYDSDLKEAVAIYDNPADFLKEIKKQRLDTRD